MTNLDKVMEEMKHVWKTESAFLSYLRGGLRRVWNKHPSKIAVINDRRIKVPKLVKGKEKLVWGFVCPLCGITHYIANGEVDHIHPAGTLREVGDIQRFVENLLIVPPSELRLICKECHSIVTLSERSGISFEEAVIEKKVIAFSKLKAVEQKKVLTELGIVDKIATSNERKDSFRKHLKSI